MSLIAVSAFNCFDEDIIKYIFEKGLDVKNTNFV